MNCWINKPNHKFINPTFIEAINNMHCIFLEVYKCFYVIDFSGFLVIIALSEFAGHKERVLFSITFTL